jgi:hypothetical protein
MGMSTHVVGIRPPDAKWTQMKAVWDACKLAGVEPPDEVLEFFDHAPPDPAGIRVELEGKPCIRAFNDDMRQGFEVDISKLPKNVTVVRFYNSW